MEKLILTSGRFTPRAGDSTEARVQALEAYLAEMSEEMELLIARLGRLHGTEARAASADVSAQEEG